MARHAWVRGTLLGESRGGVVNQRKSGYPFQVEQWIQGRKKKKKKNGYQQQGEVERTDQNNWGKWCSFSMSFSESVKQHFQVLLTFHYNPARISVQNRLIIDFPKRELLMEIKPSCNLDSCWQGLLKLSYRETPMCCQISQRY